jgi:hypothetical protein
VLTRTRVCCVSFGRTMALSRFLALLLLALVARPSNESTLAQADCAVHTITVELWSCCDCPRCSRFLCPHCALLTVRLSPALLAGLCCVAVLLVSNVRAHGDHEHDHEHEHEHEQEEDGEGQ